MKAIKKMVLLLVLLCSFPLMAHAARVPVVFGTGDEIFVVGDFPKEFVEKYQPESGLKLGYKCQHFSLFWADVWSWDCQQVAVVNDNTYADLPADASSMINTPEYAMSKAQRGFWNHYGLLCLVLVGFAWLMFGSLGKSST